MIALVQSHSGVVHGHGIFDGIGRIGAVKAVGITYFSSGLCEYIVMSSSDCTDSDIHVARRRRGYSIDGAERS
jgi:hypothetical protein